mgnify:CR=1 FL=1
MQGYSRMGETNYTNANARSASSRKGADGVQTQGSSSDLSMDTLMQLIVAQLQNQDPMNPTGQDTYMMQMAQLAVVQATNSMAQTTATTYAASLVGKEVTVVKFTDNGKKSEEVVGTVTGVAFLGGQPILYIGEDAYSMGQLIAVGKLPEEKPEKPEKPEGGGTEKPEGGEGTEKPESGEGTKPEGSETDKPTDGGNTGENTSPKE